MIPRAIPTVGGRRSAHASTSKRTPVLGLKATVNDAEVKTQSRHILQPHTLCACWNKCPMWVDGWFRSSRSGILFASIASARGVERCQRQNVPPMLNLMMVGFVHLGYDVAIPSFCDLNCHSKITLSRNTCAIAFFFTFRLTIVSPKDALEALLILGSQSGYRGALMLHCLQRVHFFQRFFTEPIIAVPSVSFSLTIFVQKLFW